jgi:hypothetical protein
VSGWRRPFSLLAGREMLEVGRGGGRELGAEGADGAPVSVVGGGVGSHRGRPVELNGAEVEGHAGDANQKVARLGQTTSVPQQVCKGTRKNPSPPCRNA